MNCPLDGTPLLSYIQADDRGIYTYYECTGAIPAHTYRATWSGIEWVPDFSEVEGLRESDSPS